MPRGFHYGWVVMGVVASLALITAGTRAAPGAFLLAMEADTGFSKGTLSIAAGLGLVLYGLAGPLSGSMVSRFGVRTVGAVAVLGTGATLFITSLASEAWQLSVFFGLLLGLSTGLVASSFGAMIANRWFVRHRGMVVGVFGASSSVGQLLFIPFLAIMATQLGWRFGVVVLAVIVASLVIPVVLLLRDTPAQMGLAPLGAAPGTPVSEVKQKADPGIMGRAVRSMDFWLLAGTFFICGATSNGLIGTHFIAHAVDHGFSIEVASGALGLIGLFNFVGVLGSGWLTDRYDPRRLLLCYYVFRGLSILYLPNIHDALDITAFSILFGLDFFATVPPTVALAADRFGRHNVGIVYGWVFAAHMVGGAIAAISAGVIRDHVGDYAVAFFAAGTLAVIGGLMALTIRRGQPPVAVPAAA